LKKKQSTSQASNSVARWLSPTPKSTKSCNKKLPDPAKKHVTNQRKPAKNSKILPC